MAIRALSQRRWQLLRRASACSNTDTQSLPLQDARTLNKIKVLLLQGHSSLLSQRHAVLNTAQPPQLDAGSLAGWASNKGLSARPINDNRHMGLPQHHHIPSGCLLPPLTAGETKDSGMWNSCWWQNQFLNTFTTNIVFLWKPTFLSENSLGFFHWYGLPEVNRQVIQTWLWFEEHPTASDRPFT